MRLNVVTPEGSVVDTSVTMVTVPGAAGELGILPGHRPLLTSLAIGELSYVVGKETEYLAVNEGYMEVHEDDVTIVTETAEAPDDIDVDRARKSLDQAISELANIDKLASPEAYKVSRDRQRRAENRIRVAEQRATPEALRKVRERDARS